MVERRYFDLVIIAPLQEEVDAIFDNFEKGDDFTADNTLAYSVKTGAEDVAALVVHPPDWGQLEAGNTTSKLLARFNIGVIVCVGIAGRLSDDLLLGDVCYSQRIYDIVDKAKATENEEIPESYRLEFTPTTYESPNRVVQSFSLVRVHPDLKTDFMAWQSACAERYNSSLLTEDVARTFGIATGTAIKDVPEVFGGSIVSAFVSASPSFNKRMFEIDRKMLAVETESGGIFAKAKDADVPVISIRGISDFADGSKGKGERAFKSAFRQIASFNAATFLLLQLRNPFFLSALRDERVRRLSPTEVVAVASGHDFIAEQLKASAAEIDANLRELSVEYRLQPKEFSLPSPRIIRVRDEATEDGTDIERVEPIEAVTQKSIVGIDIPRSYPDETAPWAIADNIVRADRFPTKFIPYVISAREVTGGSRTIDRAVGRGILSGFESLTAAKAVVVIHGVDFLASTRTKVLLAEIRKHPSCHFVLVTRNGGHLLGAEALDAGVEFYELCEVSFVALAEFIRTTFRMTENQSEVVAYRLMKTFDHFDVVAHPTYFAGLGLDTLTELLQANRRAELIQLAVDGFLTFVVADDRSDISLSRSTRRRFLEALAVQMEVEKRTFDLESVLAFAKTFAKDRDLEISESEFITAFTKKLILVHDGASIRFGLPFIKHYLLASALSKSIPLARQYFNFDSEDFDTATFDLYCEISEESTLSAQLQGRLKEHADRLAARATTNSAHYLNLQARTVFGKTDNIGGIYKESRRLVERLGDRATDATQKEQIIDFWRNMDARVKTSRNVPLRVEGEADGSGPVAAGANETDIVLRDWHRAVVMLGAAAERLSATEKRQLVELIIPLARMLVVEETTRRAEFDYKKLIDDVLEKSEIEALIAKAPSERDAEEIRRAINALIEVFETLSVSYPLSSVLHTLCEEGRQKVLGSSIDAVGFDDPFDEMLRAAWLVDIDSARGLKVVRSAVKRLGDSAVFLRALLASHFLVRVFWSHWSADDRKALVEAVDEMLPEGKSIADKGRLQRLIAAPIKPSGERAPKAAKKSGGRKSRRRRR